MRPRVRDRLSTIKNSPMNTVFRTDMDLRRTCRSSRDDNGESQSLKLREGSEKKEKSSACVKRVKRRQRGLLTS